MILESIYQNVKLREDIGVIKRYAFLILCYPKISVKALANQLFLPVPIVSAIKNELKKKSMITDQNGIVLTPKGELIIRQELNIKELDIARYLQIISLPKSCELFPNIFPKALVQEIFENRPEVDVTLDQSKCTMETSFKRACYLLQKGDIIAGSLLCVGDDDLVSVACGFLYHYITHGKRDDFQITVVDKDSRILDYIKKVSFIHQLPIKVIEHDLIHSMPKTLNGQFDAMITDPPYTLNGLELFILRGLTCLKKQIEVSVYLSFPVKSPTDRLAIQSFFTTHGILIDHISEHFNQYEGAQIIGGVSHFYHLKTTVTTDFSDTSPFTEKIYTREQNPKNRIYQCLGCQKIYQVGYQQKFTTIEQLKNEACPNCSHQKFKLSKKIANE